MLIMAYQAAKKNTATTNLSWCDISFQGYQDSAALIHIYLGINCNGHDCCNSMGGFVGLTCHLPIFLLPRDLVEAPNNLYTCSRRMDQQKSRGLKGCFPAPKEASSQSYMDPPPVGPQQLHKAHHIHSPESHRWTVLRSGLRPGGSTFGEPFPWPGPLKRGQSHPKGAEREPNNP